MNDIYLVTGCAGFIGSNLASKLLLLDPNCIIVGIDNLSNGIFSNIPKGVLYKNIDIRDFKQLEKLFIEFNIKKVFHCAALPRVGYSINNPIETNEVNINGTLNLLELSKKYKVKNFVFSSSSTVYGNQEITPFTEDLELKPESPYAIQKTTCEKYCEFYSKISTMSIVSLRYFTVYGPSQSGNSEYSTVIAAWLYGYFIKDNKNLFLTGNGEQSRDFTYIDDITEANILVSYLSSGYYVYNIGSGHCVSLNKLRLIIENLIGDTLNIQILQPRNIDTFKTFANIDKAKMDFDFYPKTFLEEGIKKTIDGFKLRQHEK
jgi:nucleoside-diphosphate-sugar epimerase